MSLRRLVVGSLVAGVVVAAPLFALAQSSGSAVGGSAGTEVSASGSTSADGEAGGGSGPRNSVGVQARTAAHARIASRLQSLLEAGVITNANAQANLQAVIERLTAELMAAGDATTEAEALTEVEAALEAEGEEQSPAVLDILAEVQARQGKKAKAVETLKARLEANPHTRAAYEKLVALEAELGARQDLDTFVKGKKVGWDVRPFVEGGRTLVPVRKLVEALGAQVDWNAEAQQVTVTKEDVTIVLTIGSQVALVNGAEVQLDVPARIAPGNRTVLPLRFVSENLGLEVTWLDESRTIVVTEEPVQ